MRQLSIYYDLQAYRSHARVGSAYRSILASQYNLVSDMRSADIVILHREPHDYASIYERVPELTSKYVVSYCVWEADVLPDAYQSSLSLVNEVWTCSGYCKRSIELAHRNVHVVPHIVERDFRVSSGDRVLIERILAFEPRCFYFLCIGRTRGHRKNLKGLVSSFEQVSSCMPGARLIIKGLPDDPPLAAVHPHIIYIPLGFSDSQINALYGAANAYVSAHHSEGWGLTMSDAMLFGLPTIATGYSGNLEFMSEESAFLVHSNEDYIAQNEIFGSFTREMKWGTPDAHHLGELMAFVYNMRESAVVQARVAAAYKGCERFSESNVRRLLLERVEAISALK